jgi:hypothetical protein
MFGTLKVAIGGVYVSTDEDVKIAAPSSWRTHPKTFFFYWNHKVGWTLDQVH